MLLSFYSHLGMPLWLSFFIAVFLTMLLSLLIEYSVYRPLVKRNSSSTVLLISSIGVMIVVINVIAMFYGNETKIISRDISEAVSFANILLTHTQLWQLGISLFLIFLFMAFLKYSRFGIKTRALRDDEELYTIMGQEPHSLHLQLYLMSGFFAATAGCLVAYDVGMDPYVGMPMLLNAVVALVIGGMGRFEAPILGGFIIGLMQALAVWAFSARWQDAVTFFLFILFLLFRPQGIMGEKERFV